MGLYKFKKSEVLYNTLELYPSNKFYVYNSVVYYNDYRHNAGAFASEATNTPSGYISLYEMNVDRSAAGTGLIYPFVVKGGEEDIFNSVTTQVSSLGKNVGDTITGSYPLSSSIIYEYTSTTRTRVDALKNTLNYYKRLSSAFDYSNFESANLGMTSIPSIFYGSSIKKGTVDLRFYVSGALIAQAKDERQNGEIIQVGPAGSALSGGVVGVILYNEGFLLLTSSLALGTHSEPYVSAEGSDNPKWLYFAAGANTTTPPQTTGKALSTSSFQMEFSGTSYLPNYTLFCRAPRGKLNNSTNPTFLSYGQSGSLLRTGSVYQEAERTMKNVVSSSLVNTTASFEKTTFVSSIGIYDQNRELLGVAKLATPVKKTADLDLTFKVKFDL